MTLPSQPPRPITAVQVKEWVATMTVKRLQTCLRATEPRRDARLEAFGDMGELCLEAIEEVRVISAQLCEESQAARLRAAETVAESSRLLAQYTPETESQLLRVFHSGPRPGELSNSEEEQRQ
jgi:hypothetical protein